MKQPSIRRLDGEIYHIQSTPFEWAVISVVHGRNQIRSSEPDNTWITLMVTSSFGSWGHHWSHCGPRKWQEFLAHAELDYIMGKFMGLNLHVFDPDSSIQYAKKEILQLRREEILTADQAAHDWLILNTMDMGGLNYTLLDTQLFIEDVAATYAFRDDYTDVIKTQINPIAEDFWNKIWLPWTKSLLEHETQ